ncbi:MAG: hypothetical protein JRH20_13430 [Deltaproteobacteria bacterium]|nr:hypothetical protein [Deltaproteobacteria bacterium]
MVEQGAFSAKIRRPVRAVHLLIAMVLLLIFIARIASIYTENINWDEFALMHRVVQTERTGHLISGGRPGLATIFLLPFVGDCADEISVIHRARLLWTFLTFAYLAAVFLLLKLLNRASRHATRDALLGVLCLAMIPPFLRWSIQVRTDQAALALATWGGVALLASRRYRLLALLGGFLVVAGFLCSQKAAYLVPPLGLLVMGDLWIQGDRDFQRTATRAALSVAGAAIAYFGFYAIISLFFVPSESTASLHNVGRTFEFYRKTLGWHQYKQIAPFLVPHAFFIVLLLFASFHWRRRNQPADDKIRMLMAWLVLGCGLGVGLFHAAAFFYFWMTLGFFVAVAVALAQHPIRTLLGRVPLRMQRAVVGVAWVALLIPGVLELGYLLKDTQGIQRDSFAFLERNLDEKALGFHPESALFCQHDKKPINTYFSQHISSRFSGAHARENAQNLVDKFVQKPIVFILDSWRVYSFPRPILNFWKMNYARYHASVWIPRKRIMGKAQQPGAFRILVPGRYRWLPAAGAHDITINGAPLKGGGVVALAAGRQRFQLSRDGSGVLLYAVKDPPTPWRGPFYKPFTAW